MNNVLRAIRPQETHDITDFLFHTTRRKPIMNTTAYMRSYQAPRSLGKLLMFPALRSLVRGAVEEPQCGEQ
jgi:hypothetical protein